jgi:hypothetical protein
MTTRAFVSVLCAALAVAITIIVLTLTGHEELLGTVFELLAGVALVAFVAALGCRGR